MKPSAMMAIRIVQAWPDSVCSVDLLLPHGAVVADALAAVEQAQIDRQSATAIYGKQVSHDHALNDGDRIEILRPLIVDPKDARRLRAARSRKRPRA